MLKLSHRWWLCCFRWSFSIRSCPWGSTSLVFFFVFRCEVSFLSLKVKLWCHRITPLTKAARPWSFTGHRVCDLELCLTSSLQNRLIWHLLRYAKLFGTRFLKNCSEFVNFFFSGWSGIVFKEDISNVFTDFVGDPCDSELRLLQISSAQFIQILSLYIFYWCLGIENQTIELFLLKTNFKIDFIRQVSQSKRVWR